MKTDWIKAPFGVFELRPGTKAILHTEDGASRDHDYSVTEIRSWTQWGEWSYVTEQEARELIGAAQRQEGSTERWP